MCSSIESRVGSIGECTPFLGEASTAHGCFHCFKPCEGRRPLGQRLSRNAVDCCTIRMTCHRSTSELVHNPRREPWPKSPKMRSSGRVMHGHLQASRRHLDAAGVLELGTCLGITTAYLGKHAASVTTIEGNPALAKHSEDVWQRLNVQNVTSIVGNFDDVLPSLPLQQYDLVFIDGNHRGSALLQYVNELAPCLTEKGVIVCDDIHWSRDMESAWDKLIQENRWSLRVDFYEWGLLTANPSLAREFHCIRF